MIETRKSLYADSITIDGVTLGFRSPVFPKERMINGDMELLAVEVISIIEYNNKEFIEGYYWVRNTITGKVKLLVFTPSVFYLKDFTAENVFKSDINSIPQLTKNSLWVLLTISEKRLIKTGDSIFPVMLRKAIPECSGI